MSAKRRSPCSRTRWRTTVETPSAPLAVTVGTPGTGRPTDTWGIPLRVAKRPVVSSGPRKVAIAEETTMRPSTVQGIPDTVSDVRRCFRLDRAGNAVPDEADHADTSLAGPGIDPPPHGDLVCVIELGDKDAQQLGRGPAHGSREGRPFPRTAKPAEEQFAGSATAPCGHRSNARCGTRKGWLFSPGSGMPPR